MIESFWNQIGVTKSNSEGLPREFWDKNPSVPEDLEVEKLWLLSDAQWYFESILSR